MNVDAENVPSTIGNGRYLLDRRIGEGGGGSVYLAHDQTLLRWVAIKRIEILDESSPQAALREAKNLASIQHSNIVTIHDFFFENNGTYVVMEFLQGENIDALQEAMEAYEFVNFARQCLEGLSAAHELGIVHRDIKSGNIMITTSGVVKILDFGLSKPLAEPSLQTLDHNNSILGSIHNMSPEQLCGSLIDKRTDIYSMGCVFYQALTRRFAFNGPNVPAVIAAHLKHDFIPLGLLRPDIPTPLAHWVERLFAFDADQRPSTAIDALRELLALQTQGAEPAQTTPTASVGDSSPILPEPTSETPSNPVSSFAWMMATAIAVLLMVVAGFIFIPRQPAPPPSVPPPQTPSQKPENSLTEGDRVTVTGLVKEVDDKAPPWTLDVKSSNGREWKIFFDKEKIDFSKQLLIKKFQGKNIQVTGTVVKSHRKTLVEIESMNAVKIEDTSTDKN